MLKNKRLIICLLWIIIHVFLILKNGIVTTGEAEKYIREADSILKNGQVISPNFWLYATQSIVILIDKLFSAHFFLVVAVQFACSLLSTFSFYKLVDHIFSPSAAFFGTILFLLNYPLHEFNSFLQTESLYNSFALIFTSYLLRITSITYRSIVVVIGFILVLTITRPVGILLVVPVLVYLLYRFVKTIRIHHAIILLTGLLLLLLFIDFQLSIGGRFNLMFPFLTEQVICFVPETTTSASIKIADNGNSFYGLIYYIVHNFGHFFALTIKKFIAFFGLTRHYFSFGHNAFLVVYFYPMYVSFLLSLRYWNVQKPSHFIYFVLILAMTLGTTILTCDDWHNRFFLSISPYVLILAIPFLIKTLRVDERGFKNSS